MLNLNLSHRSEREHDFNITISSFCCDLLTIAYVAY